MLDAYPDWVIPSHVINIVPTADRQKATVRVRIGFDELEPRILPDMGVKVSFLEDRPVEAAQAAAPRPAVRVPVGGRASRDGDTSFVWRVQRRRASSASRSAPAASATARSKCCRASTRATIVVAAPVEGLERRRRRSSKQIEAEWGRTVT